MSIILTIGNIGVILFEITSNGFIILRIGKAPALKWTLFGIFRDPKSKKMHAQLLGKKAHSF